ncbi:Hypothetical predicted protein [Pelobates cultripes]|uniref:Uncharacterized protein n=1 Tax=Pelobates cultripes TaxID=61616 RepID=A0AAD1WM00_PELCU|nr:Hypothetical predicted protein [Pelobates cultripes]
MVAMGKHSKKSRGLSEGHIRDIGQLLSESCLPKMVDPQQTSPPDSMSPSDEEDQELEEALTYKRRSKVLPPQQTEPQQMQPRQIEPPWPKWI